MPACRSIRGLGASSFALSLVVLVAAGVTGLASPGRTDPQPARPLYQAVSTGEILTGRAAPRSAETAADHVLVALAAPALVALRRALLGTGHLIRPLPWPRGDRGPPDDLS